MFCGICIEVCPFGALGMQRFYENAVYSKDDLIFDKKKLIYKEGYPELMSEGEKMFFERKRKEFRF
jgi:formate hydrogenlyase subunit 6/NADH:ubiquinone oxidoreductase subunit I